MSKIISRTTWRMRYDIQDSTFKDSLKARTTCFNKKRKAIKETEYSKDGTVFYTAKLPNQISKSIKTELRYNMENLPISKTMFNSDSSFFEQEMYFYNFKKELVEEQKYVKGYYATKMIHKYDKDGLLIETKFYDRNNKFAACEHYTYEN